MITPTNEEDQELPPFPRGGPPPGYVDTSTQDVDGGITPSPMDEDSFFPQPDGDDQSNGHDYDIPSLGDESPIRGLGPFNLGRDEASPVQSSDFNPKVKTFEELRDSFPDLKFDYQARMPTKRLRETASTKEELEASDQGKGYKAFVCFVVAVTFRICEIICRTPGLARALLVDAAKYILNKYDNYARSKEQEAAIKRNET